MKDSKFALIALGIMAVVFLASCAATAKPGTEAWYRGSTEIERAKYYTKLCRYYGFYTETPEMERCVTLELKRMKEAVQSSWAVSEEPEELDPLDRRP